MKKEPIHRVNVVYKPENENSDSCEESLSFSSEENAKAFLERQKNVPHVVSVKYIGVRG